MALNDEGGSGIPATMLVGPASFGAQGAPYPVYMGGQGGGNNGGFGDGNGWWLILVIIIIAALGGGWGNNNGGGNSGGGYSGAPIIVNSDGGGYGAGGAVQRGFDQAAVMAGINGIQGGISGLSTQLCNCCGDMQMTVSNGFAGVQQSLCNGFAGTTAAINGAQNALAQQMYVNQIAELERSYAAQTANTQGMTALQAALADCCCKNQLQTETLRATVLSENCADRYEAAQNTRDIVDAIRGGNQTILDKLCQLELDGVKQNYENRILTLQNALDQSRSDNQGLRFAASQVAQTAQLERSNGDVIEGLYNRLVQCPIPSEPVYGRQPIFVCPQQANPGNNNCGCGCNGNGF